jgi:hypothetical protein
MGDDFPMRNFCGCSSGNNNPQKRIRKLGRNGCEATAGLSNPGEENQLSFSWLLGFQIFPRGGNSSGRYWIWMSPLVRVPPAE